jgi:hypothetical protein
MPAKPIVIAHSDATKKLVIARKGLRRRLITLLSKTTIRASYPTELRSQAGFAVTADHKNGFLPMAVTRQLGNIGQIRAKNLSECVKPTT